MGNCCGGEESRGGELSGHKPSRFVNPDSPIIRLFLLGCGEVGKSTVIKQLQNLCLEASSHYTYFDETWETQKEPFKDADRIALRPKAFFNSLCPLIRKRISFLSFQVYQNVFRIIGTLIEKARQFGLHFDNSANEGMADEIMELIEHDVAGLYQRRSLRLSARLAHSIYHLWTSDVGAIRGAWNRRKEFLLSDSATYFLTQEKLDEVAADDYLPSVADLIRVRDPTVGTTEHNFLVHKVRLSLRDVGGQTVERARLPIYLTDWLSRSRPQDRNFILYVAALSDYNQRHPDGENTMLDESIAYLKVLLNLDALRDVGFLLFLNKEDIFEQKLERYADFAEYFHAYMQTAEGGGWWRGPRRPLASQRTSGGGFMDRRITPRQAKHIICSKIQDEMSTTKKCNETIYVKMTKAVDRMMMEGIFQSVHDFVLHSNIEQFGQVTYP